MQIAVTRIDKTLPLPTYNTAGAIACDLVTRETTIIAPGEIALVPGNIIVKIPEGYGLIIAPRSSLPRKKGLSFPHSMGVIDADYHGPNDELLVQVLNITKEPVTVERGERIAQALIIKLEKADWVEVEDHGAPTRGGFGTTGSH